MDSRPTGARSATWRYSRRADASAAAGTGSGRSASPPPAITFNVVRGTSSDVHWGAATPVRVLLAGRRGLARAAHARVAVTASKARENGASVAGEETPRAPCRTSLLVHRRVPRDGRRTCPQRPSAANLHARPAGHGHRLNGVAATLELAARGGHSVLVHPGPARDDAWVVRMGCRASAQCLKQVSKRVLAEPEISQRVRTGMHGVSAGAAPARHARAVRLPLAGPGAARPSRAVALEPPGWRARCGSRSRLGVPATRHRRAWPAQLAAASCRRRSSRRLNSSRRYGSGLTRSTLSGAVTRQESGTAWRARSRGA